MWTWLWQWTVRPFEMWANGEKDQPCLSLPLLLRRTVRLTMRDLTVRAADHPDMAVFVVAPSSCGRSRNSMEVLHSKPICSCEVEGLWHIVFWLRVFRQWGLKPVWDIILPPWANTQTQRATAPLGTVHTVREGTMKAHDWSVWQRSDKTIIGACRMHMFFSQTKASVTP